MYSISLKGSYFEMGIQYGKELKKAGFKVPKISNTIKKLAIKCRDYVRSFFPKYLDELRGLAQAAELDYELLCAFALVVPDIPSCTIFAVNHNKTIWIGRNYDMYYSFKKHLETTLCEPTGGYKNVGQSDIFVGREDGINEKGLGVAMAGITSYAKPGLSFWVIVRYILDKCANVDEAVKFIKEIPHYCTMSYLLADKSGKIRIVEVGPNDKIAVRKPLDGILISTNHFNHPKMQNIKIYEPSDSRIRYNKVFNSLKSKPEVLSEDYYKNLLSEHNGLVCSHKFYLGTLWSVIYNLNNLQIWRADGHPCSNPYIEDERLIKALEQ
ncbi:MAG: C45 family autoproteolytic acyltransferase/hydrolase [Candidatus Thorarchaeota archaeon]